jgi:hypothetical protein
MGVNNKMYKLCKNLLSLNIRIILFIGKLGKLCKHLMIKLNKFSYYQIKYIESTYYLTIKLFFILHNPLCTYIFTCFNNHRNLKKCN